MKHPTGDDFDVQVEAGEIEVLFRPTRSYYTFAIRSDPWEIEQYGPLSSPFVRYANANNDTDDYSPREVAGMAHAVALKALAGR
jgi:hypothetical protein